MNAVSTVSSHHQKLLWGLLLTCEASGKMFQVKTAEAQGAENISEEAELWTKISGWANQLQDLSNL